jgi:hypothetical protein
MEVQREHRRVLGLHGSEIACSLHCAEHLRALLIFIARAVHTA